MTRLIEALDNPSFIFLTLALIGAFGLITHGLAYDPAALAEASIAQ